MGTYNRKIVFDGIKKYVGDLTQQQVDSIDAILDSIEKHDISPRHAAYILATANYESRYKPVRETFASSTGQAISRLDRAYPNKKNKYWRKDRRTGKSYFGRGFIQLTWKYNYEKMAKHLNIDLVNNPDLALEPKYAAEILVYGMKHGSFTGKKLSTYKTYRSMRRIVNGTDKAAKFASLAEKLDNFTQVSYDKTVIVPTQPIPVPVAPVEDVFAPEPSFDVPVRVSSVMVIYDNGEEVVLPMPSTNSNVQNFSAEEITQTGKYMEQEFKEYKHASRSKTVWGTILGVTVLVGPLVGRMLGYDIDETWVTELGNNGAQLLQLIGGIYAAFVTVKGRHEAKSKIYWGMNPSESP